MDFGHHHHTHHRRDDDEEPPPPQPPYYPPNEFAPPPPSHHHHPPPPHYHQTEFGGPSPPGYAAPPPPSGHVTHLHHGGGFGSHQPEYGSSNYPPAPAYVTPVAHETEGHHSIYPPMPSVPHHQPHPNLGELSNKPTVKVYCKADPNFVLTIRDGKVVLAPADPSDHLQHWYRDEKFSTSVKDSVGFPGFSLVNKATGQAIKHAIGASHPLQLTPYKHDNHPDESILWSESTDTGDGYRAIRMINNIRLNVDAFHDSKKSGVHNGTVIGLWEWTKGDNQKWKIVPYCKFL